MNDIGEMISGDLTAHLILRVKIDVLITDDRRRIQRWIEVQGEEYLQILIAQAYSFWYEANE